MQLSNVAYLLTSQVHRAASLTLQGTYLNQVIYQTVLTILSNLAETKTSVLRVGIWRTDSIQSKWETMSSGMGSSIYISCLSRHWSSFHQSNIFSGLWIPIGWTTTSPPTRAHQPDPTRLPSATAMMQSLRYYMWKWWVTLCMLALAADTPCLLLRALRYITCKIDARD